MPDQILEPEGSHEPTEYAKTPKKAAASGWIGSALEYYDFFIYAQAAALVFPTLFFPSDNPQVGIVASFATFGVGYAARPLGAFILGHWGDKHGRKTVLILCMMLIGFSTFCVGLLPSYATIGIWAPILLVIMRLIQGFAVGGEIAGAGSMIMEHSPFGRRGYLQQLHSARRAGRTDPRRSDLPAVGRDTSGGGLPKLGLADPVPAQRVRGCCGSHHPPKGRRDAGVQGGGSPRRGAQGADRDGGQGERRRHAPRHLHGADERCSAYRDRLRSDVCDQRGLRSRLVVGQLPLDLGGRQHRRGDPHPVRGQPFRPDRPTAGHHRRLSRCRESSHTRTCTSSARGTS